jgi:hypothetical protein
LDPFELPPLGESTKKDFNPMVHLELEPEKPPSDDGSDKGYYEAPEEVTFDSQDRKLPLRRVRGLYQMWLGLTPDK